MSAKSAVKLRMARAVGTLLLLVFLFSHFGFDKIYEVLCDRIASMLFGGWYRVPSYCTVGTVHSSLAYQPDNNYQELGGDPYPVFPVRTGTFEP